MQREFSWEKVAGDMLEVYRWLTQGGVQPACMRFERISAPDRSRVSVLQPQ
jgi:hypothetical protein